jgi:hypothetical protein
MIFDNIAMNAINKNNDHIKALSEPKIFRTTEYFNKMQNKCSTPKISNITM